LYGGMFESRFEIRPCGFQLAFKPSKGIMKSSNFTFQPSTFGRLFLFGGNPAIAEINDFVPVETYPAFTEHDTIDTANGSHAEHGTFTATHNSGGFGSVNQVTPLHVFRRFHNRGFDRFSVVEFNGLICA
jgi:hypothetical protein